MYNNKIFLMPDRPSFPLSPIWIGQGSAARFQFLNLPKIEGLTIRLILRPMLAGGESLAIDGSVASGTGTIYCAGWYFPSPGQTKYEVIFFIPASDPASDPIAYWAGRGQLNVIAAATEAYIPGPPPAIPPETYVRNTVTGLYHLVSAAQNEYGDITLTVAEEGISNV